MSLRRRSSSWALIATMTVPVAFLAHLIGLLVRQDLGEVVVEPELAGDGAGHGAPSQALIEIKRGTLSAVACAAECCGPQVTMSKTNRSQAVLPWWRHALASVASKVLC
jgi:hypothetical protein